MEDKIPALINHDMLIWTREAGGFSLEQAAEKIAVSPEKLELWESGEELTIKDLRNISKAYNRSMGVFYLNERPPAEKIPADFRKLPKDMAEIEILEEIKPKILLEVRKARNRREVALDLAEELEYNLPEFNYRVTASDDTEEVGLIIRNILKVKVEEQFKWESPNKAWNSWRAAAENAGVLVFQFSGIKVKYMRGFSICEYPFPVIAVNSKDSEQGRIFTLLHEFVHLLLQESGICDLTEEREPKIETFCNYAAGAALVPEKYLKEHKLVLKKKEDLDWNKEWEDKEIKRLANKFRVSEEALLRRLLICDLTTEDFYKLKHYEYMKRYENLSKKEKKSGGGSYYRNTLSRIGLKFTDIVLNSFYQDIITPGDVTKYLDIKLKSLSKFEKEVYQKYEKYGVVV